MKKNKGFYIIEIIISLAVIGIIAVVFLSIFSTGLVNIVRAGVRTKAVGTAVDDFNDSPHVISSKTVEIELPVAGGGTRLVEITGSYAKSKVNVTEGPISNMEVEVVAFIPGYTELE
jgi:Tfp pilus assembly major pilin PilA